MCSWHPRQGNASLNIYKKKAILITKKKYPLPGKKPRWEFAEAGGNGPFTRKSFSSAFKWNWEAGGDGEVSQSLSVLLIDKMTLILPRITGIRSGKTYLAITQPSNTKHLLPLHQLVWNYLRGQEALHGPGSFVLQKLFPVENTEVYFYFFFCFSSTSIWNIFSMVLLPAIKFASVGFLTGTSFSLARCKNPSQWPGSFSSPGNYILALCSGV